MILRGSSFSAFGGGEGAGGAWGTKTLVNFVDN